MYKFELKVNHNHSGQPVSELRFFFLLFSANIDGTTTLKADKEASTDFPFLSKFLCCHQL